MVLSIRWSKKYPERTAEADFRYSNSERGFIIGTICAIFRPSQFTPRPGRKRKKCWRPKMSKKDIWEALFIHIQFMKDLYPQSDGRLCRYCHKSWTYITRKVQRYPKIRKKRGSPHPTNFTIDRFEAEFTYLPGNIIFCCHACNDRKHDSTPNDWKNFLRVANEKT